jgi:hypothetical protein
MAARGTFAKSEIISKIIECFGQDNAFEYDKKLYINTKENGEAVQICLSLTCPKVMISPNGGAEAVVETPKSNFSGGLDFESFGVAPSAPEPFKPAEISESERDTVRDLMARLGL